MKSNIEIIQEVIEQVVNQKKIKKWDLFFSQDYMAHGAPSWVSVIRPKKSAIR